MLFNDFRDELPPLRKPRMAKVKKVIIPTPEWCKDRYKQAHKLNFNKTAKKDGYYFEPTMPEFHKSNGLQKAIVKFILWNGFRATRISSAGRNIGGKWIPGPTRTGSADLSATIMGRSIMLEVKIGLDTPSDDQLREQELERKAGGVYEFIKTFEQFLLWYDKFLLSL